MKTFTIGWLNKCRCGNKSHSVKTARGNESALWDDDAVKCNSCGRGGVIQVCEGQARVLWETDEEMAEGKPMSTITKECIANLLQFNSEGSNCQANAEQWEVHELARIALASLEAEPVPAAMEMDDDFDSAFEHGKAVGWNACRAAMLQSFGNSEQLNSPVIPDSWVACSERLPENKPGSYEYLVFEDLNNRVQHDYWNVPDAGDDCQFTPFWNHYGRYVTHWMPLPAAPQQE